MRSFFLSYWTLANFAIWCKMGLQARFTDQQQSCPLAQAVSYRCEACSVNREMRKAPGESLSNSRYGPRTGVAPGAGAADRARRRQDLRVLGELGGLRVAFCSARIWPEPHTLAFGTSVRRLHISCCQRTFGSYAQHLDFRQSPVMKDPGWGPARRKVGAGVHPVGESADRQVG